jgi:hypothetical protein
MSVVEVARQAGHAPTMTLDTYAHVMADLEGGERVSAEDVIRAARDAVVSGKCPSETALAPMAATETPTVQAFSAKLAFGLEPKTSSLQAKNRRRPPAYASTCQHTKMPAYRDRRRIGHLGSWMLASARAGMLVCAECARWTDGVDDCRDCRWAGSRDRPRPGREGERPQARALAAAGPPHGRVPASGAAAWGRGAWRRAGVLDRRRARRGVDGALRQSPGGVLSVVCA